MHQCKRCKGVGELQSVYNGPFGYIEVGGWRVCPDCEGFGWKHDRAGSSALRGGSEAAVGKGKAQNPNLVGGKL
jgi:DnaJ-class molecular chaperone